MRRAVLFKSIISYFHNLSLYTPFTQVAAFSVPIGGFSDVISIPDEFSEHLRTRRRKPPSHKKKNFKRYERLKDYVGDDGQVEKRKIRTKPQKKIYDQHIQHLRECMTWKDEMVTLGKYVEVPQYNPERRDGEDGNIDLECLPDKWEFYNPFTKQKHAFDFTLLPLDKEDNSREAKALRWTEENIPLRDEDLPIALRNPKIREKVLKEAFGPDSTPKDVWKIFTMRPPTVKDIDPWLEEEIKKLPVIGGKVDGIYNLLTHPRTLRAAVEYLKVMNPSVLPEHVPNHFIEELSEALRSRKWKPRYEPPDPPNPYRMEDYEPVKITIPKIDPDQA